MDQKTYIFEYLKYGVQLFKYHADQRLRCIRYYTVILIACIIGIAQGARILCKRNISDELFLTIILFGLCASAGITLFFWLLDIRNRVLTEYAEDGLKTAENCLLVENEQRQQLRIVNNCEDEYHMAWHYGRILPAFFSIIIAVSIVVAIGFTIHLATWCYIIPLLPFMVILVLLLGYGVYAEGKFLTNKKKKILNEDPDRKLKSYPRYLKLFKRFYNYFPNSVEDSESR